MFLINCSVCKWNATTVGRTDDLKELGLMEIKRGCSHCGPRKFRCPRCGRIAVMRRVSGNS